MSVRALTWALGVRVGNPTRKLILITLADAANERGECWPSQRWLAQVAEVSDRSVRAHLKALQDSGVILREPRWLTTGGRTSDLFRLLGMKEDSAGPPQVVSDPPPRNGTSGITKEEPPLEPSDPPTEDGSGGFDVLWAILRRGSKKKARDQYRKAVPSKVSAEEIERGLRWYVIAYEVVQKNGRGEVFQGAHLERWIRDERWEETPPEFRPKESGPIQRNEGRSRFYG